MTMTTKTKHQPVEVAAPPKTIYAFRYDSGSNRKLPLDITGKSASDFTDGIEAYVQRKEYVKFPAVVPHLESYESQSASEPFLCIATCNGLTLVVGMPDFKSYTAFMREYAVLVPVLDRLLLPPVQVPNNFTNAQSVADMFGDKPIF